MTPVIFTARLETTSRVADLYDSHCVEDGDDQCASWFDADRDLAIIEYFCPTRAEAEHRGQAMCAFLEPYRQGDSLVATVRELPVEDWSEAWKKFFHAEKVSDRIWIKPSWESCTPAPGDLIVELDPGMSFGTGQHGTTRGCIQVLDRLAATPGLKMADIGCGSGILAIAAARLGFQDLVAVDNDPDAVRIARENAELNGVADRIRFMVADLSATGLVHSHDIVVANILAPVLIEHADTLIGMLSPMPAARLVLSGILVPQADEVCSAYLARGMRVVESFHLGEWATLCFSRP